MTPGFEAAQAMLPLLRANATQLDETASFPVSALEAMRHNGLLGLLVPVEHGGQGGDVGDMVKVAQVLASGCASTAMTWAMHCQQVDSVVRYASPSLRKVLLPEIGGGRVYLASVTTEPGKGGNLLTSNAALFNAHRDSALLAVDRAAPIVTGGQYADGFLITMRDSCAATKRQVTLIYAARDQLEIESAAGWDPLGMRGTQSVGLRLTGTVPPHQIVGEPGGFRDVAVNSMIPAGHLAWSACWLGTAHAALAQVLTLLRSPDRPGSIDPRSDLLSERIARARIDVELVAAYLARVTNEVLQARQCGESLDRPSTQIHLNNLKVIASELTFRAVDRLVQIAGLSNGYLKGAKIPLERHFRDLRSASLNNTNDRLLSITGALSLLDRSAQLP